MPYIICFAQYPPYLANEVAQKYLETLQKHPVPDYVKRVVPAANRDTMEGIQILNIDEVKIADEGKATEYMTKFMLEFRNIKEFRWEIKTWATVVEGLKYIGMG